MLIVRCAAGTALAAILGIEGFAVGPRGAGQLAITLYLAEDRVGPVAGSGKYEVRVEFPAEKRGEVRSAAPAELRLMLPSA